MGGAEVGKYLAIAGGAVGLPVAMAAIVAVGFYCPWAIVVASVACLGGGTGWALWESRRVG